MFLQSFARKLCSRSISTSIPIQLNLNSLHQKILYVPLATDTAKSVAIPLHSTPVDLLLSFRDELDAPNAQFASYATNTPIHHSHVAIDSLLSGTIVISDSDSASAYRVDGDSVDKLVKDTEHKLEQDMVEARGPEATEQWIRKRARWSVLGTRYGKPILVMAL